MSDIGQTETKGTGRPTPRKEDHGRLPKINDVRQTLARVAPLSETGKVEGSHEKIRGPHHTPRRCTSSELQWPPLTLYVQKRTSV